MKWAAENQVKAGAAGGIEAVVKAINTHINNADVCKTGCGALINMTINGKNNNQKKKTQMKWTDENKAKASAAGGIEAVVKAINIHIYNAVVCLSGCGTLYNMTANGKYNKTTSNKMNSS